MELRFREAEPYLANTKYDTEPLVIHGNGPSKRVLNGLGNYLAKAWNKDDQCTACWEGNLEFKTLVEVPNVVIGIFIEQPTPFIAEFFDKVAHLDYPKDKIDLFIHNTENYHLMDVEIFVEKWASEESNALEKYNSVKVWGPEENAKEWAARNEGLETCDRIKCDYYFSVDADAHLDNPHTLKLLIEQNRRVVAPMLVRPYKAWSNFWGALTSEGKKRSFYGYFSHYW